MHVHDCAVTTVHFLKESDLLSALLLEQSAHCFLHCKPPMIRKYAFHMILAGHRFSKSAQVRSSSQPHDFSSLNVISIILRKSCCVFEETFL